jgi:hypothetical protein
MTPDWHLPVAAIMANSGHLPAPVVNAAVAEAAKTDLLTDWVVRQGERVMAAAAPADLKPSKHRTTAR